MVLSQRWILCLPFGGFGGAERAVEVRHREAGSALEDSELGSLLGQHWHGLHGGGAGADHCDALASEIHIVFGPMAGVVGGTLECLGAGNFRHLGGGQDARGHDQELAGDDLAVLRANLPSLAALVVSGPRDARVERDVLPEVEPVRDVVEVAQNLRLGCEFLVPRPLLFKLRGEGVRVEHALDVAPCAGVLVQQPGAADAICHLDDPRAQAEVAQPVQLVQPCNAGSHHHHIYFTGTAHP